MSFTTRKQYIDDVISPCVRANSHTWPIARRTVDPVTDESTDLISINRKNHSMWQTIAFDTVATSLERFSMNNTKQQLFDILLCSSIALTACQSVEAMLIETNIEVSDETTDIGFTTHHNDVTLTEPSLRLTPNRRRGSNWRQPTTSTSKVNGRPPNWLCCKAHSKMQPQCSAPQNACGHSSKTHVIPAALQPIGYRLFAPARTGQLPTR